ncbi:tail length tape measure protein [Arthrobacter phage Liebe]|uniref:Endolysin n=2 Tax=Arthrobacter virus Liebe TaxID=2734245 RepID=A0A3G2KHR7_9CAUD|nr:tail length tape measure protein [Arthrobacter phage Liebe]AYN58501.1 endolysin [Arthrobacter phage Maureen]AZF93753.1 endolysin [Arthrobacter phage Liebe]
MTYYTWPLPEGTRVTQGFGSLPSNGVNPEGGHTGTDFAVPVGTPVRAIGAGVVKFAGWASDLPADYRWDGSGPNPYWLAPAFGGIVVVIDHGDVVSLYAHLSRTDLNVDDRVAQGQVIALSGNTGGATTGPHLHFETMPNGWNFRNGTFGRVNPALYCKGYWTGGSVTPQSSTTKKEAGLSSAEVNEIKQYIHALLIGGYTSGGKAHPGIGMVVEENQRRIDATPAKVWATTVLRGGRRVSALQELADAKTEVQALRSALAAMSTNPALTADQITAAVRAGLDVVEVRVAERS